MLVVDGGVAAVSLALACVKHRVAMVARWRWAAARYHPPGPQAPGKQSPTPRQGRRQRRLQGWAERSDTPWATVAVNWDRGARKPRGIVSRPALWAPPGWPPVAIRDVLVADPARTRRLEACVCTDLEATPVPLLPWVVLQWAVEVTGEEVRAHLGLQTQRQGADQASARTTPGLLALCSWVPVLALPLSQDERIPGPVPAWYHTATPTVADGLALGRWPLWRARSWMNAPPQAAFVQCPREAFERVRTGLP